MSPTLKQTVLSIAIAASTTTALPASAAVYDFNFNGLFTMLVPENKSFWNLSSPYYSDPTWGYGKRTPITGTMRFDTQTGSGSGTVAPFEFCNSGALVIHSFSLQYMGDGQGGPGSLILGNLLFDWNGNNGIPVSMVMDAEGVIGVMRKSGGALTVGQSIDGTYGILSASDGIDRGSIRMGNLAMASTSWNTSSTGLPCTGLNGASCMGRNPSGTYPFAADSVSGDPMIAGPFIGFSTTLDVQTMTVTSAVPIPAAAWLLGSGLIGLLGIARRRKMAV